ncbi:MAG: methyltransferase [Polyangiales bacterium]
MTGLRSDDPAPLDALDSLSGPILAELGRTLSREGYDTSAIERAEAIAPRQFDGVRLPLVDHRLAEEGASWATLARLFAYRGVVSRSAVEASLGEVLASALIGAGVLVTDGEAVRARFVLMPFEDLYVLSDSLSAGREAVMGPGITTLQLASAMDFASGDSVLDLGTGAGSLALLAARRGARVIGTDISERAIRLARFNARLNGLDVEWHVGDLFAPVAGRTFDRIVSQPPFVVSLATHGSTFLHGGERGDELAMRVLAEAPMHLAPSGTAIVRVDAPVLPGEPVSQRVRALLGERPFHVLAFASPGPSLDLQAVGYAQVADPSLGERYGEIVRAYRARLGTLGFASTSQALVLLEHAPDAPGHYALTLTPPSLRRIDSEAIADVRRALSRVAGPPDALVGAKLVVPEGTAVVEERLLGSDRVRTTIRFSKGPSADQEVSPTTAALLESFAVPRTVAEASRRFSELCDVDAEKVESQVQSFARDALVRGMLRLA